MEADPQANFEKISFEVRRFYTLLKKTPPSNAYFTGERAVVRVNGNYPAHYSKVSYILCNQKEVYESRPRILFLFVGSTE
jgi:hypothetical protein